MGLGYGVLQHDTLALLAAVSTVREMYFDPFVLPPLQKGSGMQGEGIIMMSDDFGAFDKRTRSLIGISDEVHNLKEPCLLVHLL